MIRITEKTFNHVFDAVGDFYATVYDDVWTRATSDSSLAPVDTLVTKDSLDDVARRIQTLVVRTFLEHLDDSKPVRGTTVPREHGVAEILISSTNGPEPLASFLREIGLGADPGALTATVSLESPLDFIHKHAQQAIDHRIRMEIPSWSIVPIVGDETTTFSTETRKFGNFPFASVSGVSAWLDYLGEGDSITDPLDNVTYVSRQGERLELRYRPLLNERTAYVTDREGVERSKHFPERSPLEDLARTWLVSGPSSIDTADWKLQQG